MTNTAPLWFQEEALDHRNSLTVMSQRGLPVLWMTDIPLLWFQEEALHDQHSSTVVSQHLRRGLPVLWMTDTPSLWSSRVGKTAVRKEGGKTSSTMALPRNRDSKCTASGLSSCKSCTQHD